MQTIFRVLVLSAAVLATPALAHVTVDAIRNVEERLPLAAALDMRLDLATDVASGVYDRSGITIPVLEGGRVETRALTSDLFARLAPAAKTAVAHRLAEYAEYFFWRSYTVTIDADNEDLSHEEILPRLGLDPATISGATGAEQLLSSYARTWAYQDSRRDGPNCWHTSVASVFPGWDVHRYMGDREFSCHMDNSFVELTDVTPDDLQFGDLIRLTDGGEVHGFTYIGTDRNDASRHIVFTKNGYARGYFLFMELDTVHNDIYWGTDISYLRPTRTPVDPAVDDESECFDEYDSEQEVREPDPLVVAGFRKGVGREMAPVTLAP